MLKKLSTNTKSPITQIFHSENKLCFYNYANEVTVLMIALISMSKDNFL